jgi:hypothetical protein
MEQRLRCEIDHEKSLERRERLLGDGMLRAGLAAATIVVIASIEVNAESSLSETAGTHAHERIENDRCERQPSLRRLRSEHRSSSAT